MSKKKSVTFRETQTTEISGERRSRRRYPLSLPVQFKIMKNCVVVGTGDGTSLDLSSSGIAFSTASPPRIGSYLELSISWPVLLNGSCPLKLVATGRVVRSGHDCTAIAMDRHVFRTQGAKAARAASGRDAFTLALQ